MAPGPGTAMVCGTWGMITTMTVLMLMLASTGKQLKNMPEYIQQLWQELENISISTLRQMRQY